MLSISPTTYLVPAMKVSPLTLSHQLLMLAEQADQAGLDRSARSLLKLAHTVCDDRPRRGLALDLD